MPTEPTEPTGPIGAPNVDGAVRQAAERVAHQAADAAGVVLREVHDPDELRGVSALFDTVWGRAGDAGAVLSPEALGAIGHAGGQVTAALRDGRLVGATAAFHGRDADATPFLHSHVTGVLDEVTTRGIGAALKWHQRAWCLARDLTEVRWTFDPLVRRNVAFNLVRLGAQVDRYMADAYGRMPDARNLGLPTDRLLARWPLTSRRVEAAGGGRTASPDVDALRRTGAEVALDVAGDGTPHVTVTAARRRLVRIPDDIETLRRTDPDLATAWSAAVRTTLGAALDAGARLTGATRDGWLVVAAGDGVAELAR